MWVANDFNDLTLPSLVAQGKGGCGVTVPTGFREVFPGTKGLSSPFSCSYRHREKGEAPSPAPWQAAPFSGNLSPTPSFYFHSLGHLVRQVGHRDG